jgi:hypothetical protein
MAERDEADAVRLSDRLDVGEMAGEFGRRLVKCLDRRARELKLAARLQRDRAAPLGAGETDDMAGIDDRLPAELALHAFQKVADTARGRATRGLRPALIGNRREIVAVEREFLVLGAKPEG